MGWLWWATPLDGFNILFMGLSWIKKISLNLETTMPKMWLNVKERVETSTNIKYEYRDCKVNWESNQKINYKIKMG